MLKILLYIWQIPQNLLGLLLLAFYGWHSSFSLVGNIPNYPPSSLRFSDKMKGGICLGHYIILESGKYNDETSWNHERGHAVQSMILGPFYLIIIGFPSLIWAATYKMFVHEPKEYYLFYTEKWADKLGGVER